MRPAEYRTKNQEERTTTVCSCLCKSIKNSTKSQPPPLIPAPRQSDVRHPSRDPQSTSEDTPRALNGDWWAGGQPSADRTKKEGRTRELAGRKSRLRREAPGGGERKKLVCSSMCVVWWDGLRSGVCIKSGGGAHARRKLPLIRVGRKEGMIHGDKKDALARCCYVV